MGHSRYSRTQLARGEGRQWKTVKKDGNVHFIEHITPGGNAPGPARTHSKTKVYVSKYERPGKEFGKVKEISVMNPKTGMKAMDIHTKDEGNGPHVHKWNESVRGKGIPLTQGQRKFVEKIQRMAKDSDK
ncbi:MAG: hypothetical protein J6L64_02735 [Opitutales bacterium]|nr:hypothetical protein [Opitutales bacterium]